MDLARRWDRDRSTMRSKSFMMAPTHGGGDLERAGVRVLARALVSDDEGEYFFAALPAPHLAHGELVEHVAVRGGDDAEAMLEILMPTRPSSSMPSSAHFSYDSGVT